VVEDMMDAEKAFDILEQIKVGDTWFRDNYSNSMDQDECNEAIRYGIAAVAMMEYLNNLDKSMLRHIMDEEESGNLIPKRHGKTVTVVDILDHVMEEICSRYCKYPDILSEEELNDTCDSCPFEWLS
jgi:hypothetical protein